MRNIAIGLIAVAVIPGGIAIGRVMMERDVSPPTFELNGRPIGGAKPAATTAAHLTATRIVAHGDGALVIDGDSGALIKTDASGKNIAQVAIGKDAGLMTVDPIANLAFVADRLGDKITVVKLGAKLEVARTIKTPAEPYAVALTPDRKTLLVSTIADRTLVAFDATTGTERWRTPLGREPRGLAISQDGSRALVSYLVTGTVDQIDLVETHRAQHVALSTTGSSRRTRRGGSNGDSFARAAFAVTFMGASQAVVPFQRETPVQQADGSENTGSYGGGFESPVTHQVAFLGFGRETPAQITAAIAQHQPRAVAWDGARDALYLAGMGSDSILQVKNASQVGITEGVTAALRTGKDRCGPDGLAVASDGDVLVWCAFTRTVQRVDFVDAKGALATTAKVSAGPTLIATRYSAKQHKGLVLFHAADPAMSARGALACSTCHPDNRADGLSWRIDKMELQTPLLAGRIAGTHPFKWDGGDKDLKASLTGTMKRLGGFGLDKSQTEALAAYVEGLPTVRTPTREVNQVARGRKLFDSAEMGCRSCHDGPAYTDQSKHKLSGTLKESDTPSLLGLAASAPYFHDGSAATLEALLRDRGAVHGMAETSKLSDPQVADLSAFLESL
ncbi:MAG TPA: c-type cytochrome [Kofleriaceae bacterium]